MSLENVKYGLFVSIVEEETDRFVHLFENQQILDINTFLNNYNWTALQTAAYTGNEFLVNYLLERGADLTLTNKRGLSAMQMAIQSGHLHLVSLLDPSAQSALPQASNASPQFQESQEEQSNYLHLSYDSSDE